VKNLRHWWHKAKDYHSVCLVCGGAGKIENGFDDAVSMKYPALSSSFDVCQFCETAERVGTENMREDDTCPQCGKSGLIRNGYYFSVGYLCGMLAMLFVAVIGILMWSG